MISGFRALPNADLTRAVEELLLPRLAGALRGKAAGHCMRVTDLDRELMVAVAKGLRKETRWAAQADFVQELPLFLVTVRCLDQLDVLVVSDEWPSVLGCGLCRLPRRGSLGHRQAPVATVFAES
jgi:hypothetical protein